MESALFVIIKRQIFPMNKDVIYVHIYVYKKLIKTNGIYDSKQNRSRMINNYTKDNG